MFKILSVFLILNFSIIGVAIAQQNMKKNSNSNSASIEKLSSEEMGAKVFKEMDTDGNGCVSFEEFKAFSKKRMQHENMKQKQNVNVNK